MEIVVRNTRVDRPPKDELISLTSHGDAAASAAINLSDDEILRILETQPVLEDLSRCLKWLVQHQGTSGNFNVRLPGPRAARIVNALVAEVAANFWDLLCSDPRYASQLEDLLSCLRSIPGLGAIVMRIKALAAECNRGHAGSSTPIPQHVQNMSPLIATRGLLARVIHGKDTVNQILETVFAHDLKGQQQQALWNQGTALLGGGRILSALAQADLLIFDKESQQYKDSLGNGAVYLSWLGENLRNTEATQSTTAQQRSTAKAALFSKAASLGYTQQLVESTFEGSLAGDELRAERDFLFLMSLKVLDQRQVLYTLLRLASRPQYRDSRKEFVAGLASLLQKWCSGDLGELRPLLQWIAGVDRGRAATHIAVHRAVIAVLADSIDLLVHVCEVLIKSFGDPMYIQNAPIAQQEVQVQDILLAIGRLFLCNSDAVKNLLRSSVYINAISSRLASSASRPRLLGMYVAVAVSQLTEGGRAQLRFEEALSNSEEMEKFKALLNFNDKVSRISDLQSLGTEQPGAQQPHPFGQDLQPSIASSSHRQSQPMDAHRFESEEEDDDPTLVNRKKPPPPVYVRDLLRGLHNSEEQDRYRICLLHAAKLIRRKANFGSEVMDHLEELATTLSGASDTFESKQLAEAQLQGMIAVIAASPSKMGLWFSVSVFAGDYSVSQRMSMLTALVFAARELAGHKSEDSKTLSSVKPGQTADEDSFPSKRLPSGLGAFSGSSPAPLTPIDVTTSKMEQALIQPMAASAADQFAGPDSLKVRTFSSRLKPDRKLQHTISNELSKVVADSIFFPLTDRFRLDAQTRGSSSPYALPSLLAHLLKTLGLLIAASGPHTLSLPALSSELLALCLSSKLRQSATTHLPVLESLLFCLLVLLEVNSFAAKRFVSEQGSGLLEAKAWVEIVLDRISPGDKETERVRTLGAGVLVYCTELMNKHQEEMMERVAEFF